MGILGGTPNLFKRLAEVRVQLPRTGATLFKEILEFTGVGEDDDERVHWLDAREPH